jgi:flagellar basal-body rod modification protein FlgD
MSSVSSTSSPNPYASVFTRQSSSTNSSGSSSSSTQSAATIQTNFLTLLVNQLKNQNPLEPMDNTQMATQMAQLSQLEQMENLNTTFSKVAASQQLSEASGLLGKKVTYLDSQSQTQQGTVSQVTLSSGTINLLVGNSQVSLDNIVSVQNT